MRRRRFVSEISCGCIGSNFCIPSGLPGTWCCLRLYGQCSVLKCLSHRSWVINQQLSCWPNWDWTGKPSTSWACSDSATSNSSCLMLSFLLAAFLLIAISSSCIGFFFNCFWSSWNRLRLRYVCYAGCEVLEGGGRSTADLISGPCFVALGHLGALWLVWRLGWRPHFAALLFSLFATAAAKITTIS